MTHSATVEPSEVGLSDRFMVEGRRYGRAARPALDITMVRSYFPARIFRAITYS
jgi:hypothetical protein